MCNRLSVLSECEHCRGCIVLVPAINLVAGRNGSTDPLLQISAATKILNTLPKTNIAPKNGGFQ